MLKRSLLLAFTVIAVATTAGAGDRYKILRPVLIESGIAGQWEMQLSGPVRPVVYRPIQPVVRYQAVRQPVYRTVQYPTAVVQQTTVTQQAVYQARQAAEANFDPQFMPQTVEYVTKEKPGTIVIDTNNRFLYLVLGDGRARRYGVGVGKPGFEWSGVHKITRKAEWPDWTPPSQMIAREAEKGHILPAHMDGGDANPLGARAMYLGSTEYRIHGTNAPWTIGYAVSSGCIRMRNEDVVDLYERVRVGTRVIVM
jgi:lipoprotein-anchoring transpeptidase ErfK/SrfK